MTGRRPDVLYIGLYRAASTALRAYFDSHPETVYSRRASFLSQPNYREARPYEDEPAPSGQCYIDMLEGLASGHVFQKEVDNLVMALVAQRAGGRTLLYDGFSERWAFGLGVLHFSPTWEAAPASASLSSSVIPKSLSKGARGTLSL